MTARTLQTWSALVIALCGATVAAAQDQTRPPATLPAPAAAAASVVTAQQLSSNMKFSERPAWQERLDWIGRHGLPFARLRDNRDSQLVVGMHPEGYFGIFLTPKQR
jgi:hypothetical protein